jgi:hypothetical protein
MSQGSSATAFDELAHALSPASVSSYLASSRSWHLDTRRDEVSEIWSLPGEGQELQGRIMLPLATDYVDFHARFADALRGIALSCGWTVQELEQAIVSTYADVLLVHLDQADPDGTIPLRQAEATIDALGQMLKSAAITAAAPNRVQRGGRLPLAVSSYLEEAVRLGHTKPGSFVFTVISRLGDAQDPDLRRTPAFDGEESFPRKVMETLARGLETTSDLVHGGSTTVLDSPAQWGLSAGLVESIESLMNSDRLRSLELRFHWAPALPAPSIGSHAIALERAELDNLAQVHERLVLQEQPPHRETLFGQVISLSRDESGVSADGAGTVVVSAEIDGRKRSVHMTLAGSDHDRAIEAYQRKLPLIVTGDLVFERRAWRLIGEVDVDASLIKRGRQGH